MNKCEICNMEIHPNTSHVMTREWGNDWLMMDDHYFHKSCYDKSIGENKEGKVRIELEYLPLLTQSLARNEDCYWYTNDMKYEVFFKPFKPEVAPQEAKPTEEKKIIRCLLCGNKYQARTISMYNECPKCNKMGMGVEVTEPPAESTEEICEHGIPKMICSQGHGLIKPEESEVEEIEPLKWGNLKSREMVDYEEMKWNKINEIAGVVNRLAKEVKLLKEKACTE